MNTLVDLTTLQIRPANTNDAEGIAKVHVLSWQKIYRGFLQDDYLDNISVQERIELWLSLLEQRTMIYVIEQQKQIIGFVSLCPFRSPKATPEQGEISALYLHPLYWRYGLGSKLMHVALKALEQEGFTEILLWVLDKNITAQRFYEAQGFQSTEILETVAYGEGLTWTDILYRRIQDNLH